MEAAKDPSKFVEESARERPELSEALVGEMVKESTAASKAKAWGGQ